jgi:hypothetical protein
LIPKTPLNIKINVTGIAENHAEFTWKYVDLPLPFIAKEFIFDNGNGSADFTLNDDGWRVVNFPGKAS